jgi:hypothetical protein
MDLATHLSPAMPTMTCFFLQEGCIHVPRLCTGLEGVMSCILDPMGVETNAPALGRILFDFTSRDALALAESTSQIMSFLT